MRLAMPLLAMMKSRVMGPGTPSVRLSPLPALASSPSAAPASPDDPLDDDPATSYMQQERLLLYLYTNDDKLSQL